MNQEACVVSVMIPAYNQGALLVRLLDSLAAQEDAPPFEIIVVDDASTDATADLVAQWREAHSEHSLHYCRLPENAGPGRARNAGVAQARGRYIAFTDTDCVADPGWLKPLVDTLEKDPALGGCGGRVEALAESNATARYNILNRSLAPQQYLTYLVTCNCCYRRAALLAGEGFTEDIRTPGGEDIAASIHVWKAGYRYAYVDAALIYHDFQPGIRRFLRTWRNYGYGCGLITHRFLRHEELHPEDYPHDAVAHFWRVDHIRPNVTGVRSLIKDLRQYYVTARGRGAPLIRIPELLCYRTMDRVAYAWGWRQGRARYHRERQP